MPELDPTNTDNEQDDFDPTSVGGEIDEDLNADISDDDRGDNFDPDADPSEPEADPEPEPEPEADPEEEDPEKEGEAAEDPDPEPEADPEADPEPEPDPEEDPEPEKEVKEQRIPKSRFDQVNDKRKVAELRIRELEAEAALRTTEQPAEKYDFDAAEETYMNHVLDGETDKAKVVRAEIRAAERSEIQAMTSTIRDEAVGETQLRQEYMVVVDSLQKEYSEFDPEGKDFAQDLVDEVLDMKDAFLAKSGNVMTPGQALGKASKYIASMHGLENTTTPKEADPVPEVDPKKVVSKKKVNVKEKVAQSKAQPPNMDAGETDIKGTPNILEMSEDEFDALPEAAKRRIRGDVM